jgi:hypothetical protein
VECRGLGPRVHADDLRVEHAHDGVIGRRLAALAAMRVQSAILKSPSPAHSVNLRWIFFGEFGHKSSHQAHDFFDPVR